MKGKCLIKFVENKLYLKQRQRMIKTANVYYKGSFLLILVHIHEFQNIYRSSCLWFSIEEMEMINGCYILISPLLHEGGNSVIESNGYNKIAKVTFKIIKIAIFNQDITRTLGCK